ncbi:MAG: type II TA system antitoxin MqsA family protein [Candidatus Thiodiazotropha endolucinida]
MNTCSKCGGSAPAEKLLPQYTVTSIGLEVVVVNSVNEFTCEACGEAEVSVPDLQGLIAAAAVARVQIPQKLNSKEVKFLRKSIQLTAKQLGDLLEVSQETISRWENDKTPIGPGSEKLLRLLVGILIGKNAPGVDFDEKSVLDMKVQPIMSSPDPIVMQFERVLVKIDEKKEKKYSNIELAA